jgi:hypothetical protein
VLTRPLVIVAIATAVVGVAPAAANAERFVGKTSQGRPFTLSTYPNRTVDFRLNFRARCSDLSSWVGWASPSTRGRPKLRDDNRFAYRGESSGKDNSGRYKLRVRGTGYVPPAGPARGTFRAKLTYRDGTACRAHGTWRARRNASP